VRSKNQGCHHQDGDNDLGLAGLHRSDDGLSSRARISFRHVVILNGGSLQLVAIGCHAKSKSTGRARGVGGCRLRVKIFL